MPSIVEKVIKREEEEDSGLPLRGLGVAGAPVSPNDSPDEPDDVAGAGVDDSEERSDESGDGSNDSGESATRDLQAAPEGQSRRDREESWVLRDDSSEAGSFPAVGTQFIPGDLDDQDAASSG
mmetsp:Transcript_82145/g.266065  ORF Transcript_82145/g.266065 Transcript_82145/m.266065 type:complete len:123 (+) Transcript_82145:324-692(+)